MYIVLLYFWIKGGSVMDFHPDIFYKGKVKKFLPTGEISNLLMCFSDAITAGDGEKRDVYKRLGEVRYEIAKLIFEYLRKLRTKTHYVGDHTRTEQGEHCLEVLWTIPIDLEVVVRFEAEGSYLSRFGYVAKGQEFFEPIIEIFYKDDSMHDPLLVINQDHTGFITLHPKTGYFFGYDLLVPYEEIFPEVILKSFSGYDIYQQLVSSARYIATTVRNIFWPEFSLIDIKLEFGWQPELGIILIDAITPDEWRLRRNSDGLRYDKDIYREFGLDQLPTLLQRYQAIRDYIKILT
jgi:phosphoribosylaminoimidazole-succinocarboxamide synthase